MGGSAASTPFSAPINRATPAAFCTLGTFRRRRRQSPQRSSRLPRRSIWMIMSPSISSTLVTVCMGPQSQVLSDKRFDQHLDPSFRGCDQQPSKIGFIGVSCWRPLRQPAASKTLQLQLHSWDISQQPVHLAAGDRRVYLRQEKGAAVAAGPGGGRLPAEHSHRSHHELPAIPGTPSTKMRCRPSTKPSRASST